MSQVFPERFDLEKMHGSRAVQFVKREDAFQQLVGDGLMAAMGHLVEVAPTKGQDGGIDAFVEAGGQLGGAFKDLAVPLVVECKDHDDTLRGVSENVLEAWKKLEIRLRRQAQKGWPSLFSPWKRALGYAYCVSAFLPAKEMRDKLERRIKGFFGSLPADQRPPIKAIRVIGWNELRFWLGTLPQVTEAWLGVEIPHRVQPDFDAFLLSAKGETCTKTFHEWAGEQRVTLAIVFTDVIGSTALGDNIRDEAMNEVRRAHFAQGRKLIAKFNGREVKTIGDSFMVAFKCADGALDYARAFMENSGDPQVQIRAGIHIGPMNVEEGDLFGSTVDFAARVLGAIKGPEIWLSNSAKQDIDRLGACRYHDLKWERHKGVPMKGFRGVFTLWSLRKQVQRQITDSIPVHSMPTLFGREAELQKLTQLFAKSAVVCVTGLPGVGKSTLAEAWLNAQGRSPMRRVVSLDVGQTPTLPSILARLLAQLGEPRDLAPSEQTAQVALNVLCQSPAILFLDNFELIASESMPQIESFLAELPKARCSCLVASRRKFDAFSSVLDLRELALPEAKNMLRSRLQDSDGRDLNDRAIENLARAVGCLPLAIEAIAPLVAHQPVHTLLRSLGPESSTNSLPRRLNATFEMCYRSLPSLAVRKFFRLLCALPADFSPELAGVVGRVFELPAETALAELSSRSLCRLTPSECYSMHPVTKQFGSFRVEPAERKDLERALISHFTGLGALADLWDVSVTRPDPWAVARHRFKADMENIIALLKSLVDRNDGRAAPLAVACADALMREGQRTFLRQVIERCLGCFGSNLPDSIKGRLHAYLGCILHRQRELHSAAEALDTAIRYCAASCDWRYAGFAHLWLGWVRMEQNADHTGAESGPESAMRAYLRAREIADKHGDELLETYVLQHFGHDAYRRAIRCTSAEARSRLLRKAMRIYQKVAVAAERMGAYERCCRAHSALAKLMLNSGDYLQARKHACESEKLALEIEDGRSQAVAKGLQAKCLLQEFRAQRRFSSSGTEHLTEAALRLCEEALQLETGLGDKLHIWHVYYTMSQVFCCRQEWEEATWALAEAKDAYVPSSGSKDQRQLGGELKEAVRMQIDHLEQMQKEGEANLITALSKEETLARNHQGRIHYDKVGITLVWGLPNDQHALRFCKRVTTSLSRLYPEFIGRDSLCLHGTILTLKKVSGQQKLESVSEWPAGTEKAIQELVDVLESDKLFQVVFKGLCCSTDGEVLVAGFPADEGLAVLRGRVRRLSRWKPSPWHKGALHITLGYFREPIRDASRRDRLRQLFKEFGKVPVAVTIDRLKIVHFVNRELTNPVGSVELLLADHNGLSARDVLFKIGLSCF